MTDTGQPGDLQAIRDHRRQWRNCRYVYPVLSRRAKGLSIGVNLNPDMRCTFGCVYCQIDRRTPRGLHEVDMRVLADELRLVLEEATMGDLWQEQRFAGTPESMKRINDIAFSGDGEPTVLPAFDQAVQVAAGVRNEFGARALKLVVITNATQFDQPQFARALPILDANNGEIWAKLDAGSEEFFARVNHPYPRITLEHILRNITIIARGRPIVIQSLFFSLEGIAPHDAEVRAYCDNLRHMLSGGARFKLIQVHTIARTPSSPKAAALGNEQLDAIAAQIRAAAPSVPVETYYGVQQ